MNTRKFLLPASALAVTGALAVGWPATANAATAPSKPPGYRVVFGPDLPIADGTQARNTVQCPKGTVPLGGGIFVDSISLTAGVSSSFPSANGWTGVVDNQSGQSASFLVAVTCANKPAHYSIVRSKPVVNPTLHRTTVTVSCPQSAKPLGGGSQATDGFFVSLGGSRPFQNGWRVTQENDIADITARSTSNPTVTAVAICGSVAGYRVVSSKPQPVPALSQPLLSASCPMGTVVLGGGAAINAKAVGVNFNMSGPIDPTAAAPVHGSTTRPPFGWDTIVNNNNEVDATAAPFAICAGH